MNNGADRPLSVSIVEGVAGFQALRAEWGALRRESGAHGPFLAWDWLFAWWQADPSRSGLRLLLVRDESRLVAIAPLRLVRGAFGFARLEFLGTGLAGSDYLDVIVAPGFEVEAIERLAEALASLRVTLRLGRLPGHALARRLAQRLEARGWTCRTRDHGFCPVIRLEGRTFDSYLSSRGASHRANVRRRLRHAARDLDMRFERITDDAGRLRALEALAGFHQTRWPGRPSTAFFSPWLRAFHRRATESASGTGELRLFALHLRGQLAGVMYAFVHDRRYFFYQHGFDPQFRHDSPGLVLMALTIEAAFEEHAVEFDLLSGDEPYKLLWADGTRPLVALDAFPPGLVGRLQARRLAVETALRPVAQRWRARVARVG